MNPHLERLQPYPFERWRAYIGHTHGPETLPPISLAIGEPRHPTPSFLQQALGEHAAGMAHYPQTAGRPSLRTHIADWLARRYQIPALDPDHQVLPTLGSREALFAITQVLLDPCAQEYVICPNPFYQIYEGATLLAGGHPYFLNAQPAHQDRFDYADIPTEILSRTRLIFLCSPNNPTGQILTLEDWQQLFQLSDRYGLTLVSDECYSEIYPDEEHPPLGALEAAHKLGRHGYPRLLVMGSLSKRSNVPGLRSGYVAGDATLLHAFTRYRTYHGSAMSPVVQAVSELAWQDETHVQENRRLYREKMARFAQRISTRLTLNQPQAGFYYWARVPGDDVAFAYALYLDQHLTLLPGSYLAREAHGINPGAGHVRIALVGSLAETDEAIQRLTHFMDRYPHALENDSHVDH